MGGHEWRDIGGLVSHIPAPDTPGIVKGICPACTRAGRGRDDVGDKLPVDYGPAYYSIGEAHDAGEHAFCGDDCEGPGCGPSDCGATAATADMTFGPCIKRERHKDWHEDANGARWTTRGEGCGHTEGEGCGCPPEPAVSVPAAALSDLVHVARWAASERERLAAQGRHIVLPDATAARALAALDDAGLLDQVPESD
ncbi:hypothetical protein [Streptomyces rhizosphaerihabitans]|uniref:hypothetical protein n=1 Tax=Streptomyces rhizosphaerihabitans TaxID=1266770 RepID=UPI0021C11CE9|nr:hypothetical protein [Streptomyces rhizosphaerihabitans]MCT9010541.1 hypothetical protein [Streptomyces rhizosphaerihabitans]